MGTLSTERQTALSQAFEQILDPAVLEEVISLWPTDPEAALALVNLTPEDMEDFQVYLDSFELPPTLQLVLAWWPIPI